MPKILGMEPGTAKIVGLVGVGGVALYFFTHQGGSAGAAQSADAGLPATGPISNAGSGDPNLQNYFNNTEQAAARLSKSDLFLQNRTAQMASESIPLQGVTGAGPISKGWQEIQGGWADIAHPGHEISEQEAIALGPQNHGPYAKGGGGVIGDIWSLAKNVVQQVVNVYSRTQGVPLAGSSPYNNPPSQGSYDPLRGSGTGHTGPQRYPASPQPYPQEPSGHGVPSFTPGISGEYPGGF